MRATFLPFLVVLLLTILALSPGPVDACAAVGPPASTVAIASETVLIVWDEKTKTQHFIRRASFTTPLPYFGFLVPTPTPPELAEAPDELFTTLRKWTEPQVKTAYSFEPATLSADLGPSTSGVDVLAEKRVGGFDATVLRARDPGSLRGWLEKRGFDSRPSLTSWLGPYIEKGWTITAFQIAKKEKESDWVETRAVRMSFRADRPFFPYREPADPREKDRGPRRLLRVYLIAPERRTGQFDDERLEWRGQPVWAAPLRREQAEEVTRLIDAKDIEIPEGAYLTELEDRGAVRPDSSDLFFVPDRDQFTFRRPDVYRVVKIDPLFVKMMVAGVVIVVVVFVALEVGRRWKRRAGAA